MKNSQKGSSLIEAVVALGAIVVTIAAVSILAAVSASNAEYIKNQNNANKYAQEGMEFIKSMQDQSYDMLTDKLGSTVHCLTPDLPESIFDSDFDTKVPIGGCSTAGSIIDARYRRTVLLEDVSDCKVAGSTLDSRKVTVAVSWQSGKCTGGAFCHNVTISSCITKSSNNTP